MREIGASPKFRATLHIGIALALVMACSAPLPGDDAPQTEPRLVDLNVVALDSHGQPVSDLTSADFQITDGGKQQRIAFFRHADRSRWKAESLAPHEFSNRAGPAVPYATVILFDLMNEGFEARGYASNQIVHDLENLETADYLYFYILAVDGQLHAVQGLPVAAAGTATQQVRSSADSPWTRQIKPLLDQAMRSLALTRPFDVDVAGRVNLTFQALETLAVQLSRIPGRKNVLWVTDGVPLVLGPMRSDTGDYVDFTPQIRQLSEALDRSGIAIYPVRQVMLGAPDSIGTTSDSPQAETGGQGTGLDSIATLNSFAGMTGGRPTSGKDVGAALKQAMNDVRASYQMGYYPPPENWDNKYRKLRVICTRKGVHVQAKTGYYAWAQPAGARAEQAFQSAASTAFDAAEIGLRAKVSVDPSDERVANFDLRIDANDIVWVREGKVYSAQLRLMLIHYLTNGHIENWPAIPVDVHYNLQQHDQALTDGIDFAQDVPVGGNGTQFRIIVFDRGSNAVGSITIPDYDNSHVVLPQLNSR